MRNTEDEHATEPGSSPQQAHSKPAQGTAWTCVRWASGCRGEHPVCTVRFTPLGSPWDSPNWSYVHVPVVTWPGSGTAVSRTCGVLGAAWVGTGRVVYRGTTHPPSPVPTLVLPGPNHCSQHVYLRPPGTPGPAWPLRTPGSPHSAIPASRTNKGEI